MIHSETGWNVDFSPSVRQDLMQHELSRLLGGLTQPPSIHIQERNKYHKMFVEKWYLILYQIKDQIVYVDYIVDCRQDYRWLVR